MKTQLTYGDIDINPVYDALLPKLSDDDYKALLDSIRRDGLWYPITVNEEGVILDGHNRYRACRDAAVALHWEVVSFPDPLLEKKYVIECNLNRRHLTDIQKIEFGLELETIEGDLAKRRMSEAGKIGVEIREGRLSSNELTLPGKGQARDIVARKVGVSPTTFERGSTVLEKGSEELKQKVRSGKVSISRAYNELRPLVKEWRPQLYTVWNFQGREEGYGTPNFPGGLPASLVRNVIHYWSIEGELVVDPMAGSGTTPDVCAEMNRRCLSSDIAPIRHDILKHDITQGYFSEAKGCDLVLLDPPYWRMMKNYYSADSVSSLSLGEFYGFVGKLAKDTYETLRNRGRAAFIIANQTEKDLGGEAYLDHGFRCYELFLAAGFRPVQRIVAPMNTQDFGPEDVKRAKDEHRLIGTLRDLLVFKKDE